MINFRTGIPLLITQLLPCLAQAQADTTAIARPVDMYTIPMADSFVRIRKYERAVWLYINLYPKYPDTVVARVRQLQPKIWDGDVPAFVQSTFARFAPLDPAIGTFDFEGFRLDSAELKRKAAWSDALIRRIGAGDSTAKPKKL